MTIKKAHLLAFIKVNLRAKNLAVHQPHRRMAEHAAVTLDSGLASQ
jgi:hypothetical protein